jgi:hypothetical protein
MPPIMRGRAAGISCRLCTQDPPLLRRAGRRGWRRTAPDGWPRSPAGRQPGRVAQRFRAGTEKCVRFRDRACPCPRTTASRSPRVLLRRLELCAVFLPALGPRVARHAWRSNGCSAICGRPPHDRSPGSSPTEHPHMRSGRRSLVGGKAHSAGRRVLEVFVGPALVLVSTVLAFSWGGVSTVVAPGDGRVARNACRP